MSLRDWLNDGHLKPHRTSASEVAILYNAALQLATLPQLARGYRTTGPGHRWVTFRVLPDSMGSKVQELADYFEHCRARRNTVDYDRAGVTAEAEVEELRREVRAFRTTILAWLGARYPRLCPPDRLEGEKE